MFLNLIDKCLFGAALLFTLQIPILADHYAQFIAGAFDATKTQVQGYEATAAKHQFANVKAMIETHLHNPEPSVRTDAMQKLDTLIAYEDLKSAMQIFTHGNIFEKALYMFKPAHWDTLKKVIANFKPSIPLSIEYVLYAFVIALGFSAMVTALLRAMFRRKAA